MDTPPVTLVRRFYDEMWNRHDPDVARQILHPSVRFRGSFGPERVGPEGFIAYFEATHASLGSFTCFIDDVVEAPRRAAVRLRFAGVHRGALFGVPPTQKHVEWPGAAFFTTDGSQIVDVWVLGDNDALKRQLGSAPDATFTL